MLKVSQSTQAHLDIAEIRDSIVVLKDGSLRLVMMVSAINLDLKSEEEQEALIYQYQNFLHSLNFPIQILIQSRRLDLGSYLKKLEEKVAGEENELLKAQGRDYLSFLKELIPQANIMDKKFYLIVPYFPPLFKAPSFLSEIWAGRPTKKLTTSEFQSFKKELLQRANLVASGLAGLGLRCLQLNTQELIELFYNTYNPELGSREKLLEAQELEAEVIEKAKEER